MPDIAVELSGKKDPAEKKRRRREKDDGEDEDAMSEDEEEKAEDGEKVKEKMDGLQLEEAEQVIES